MPEMRRAEEPATAEESGGSRLIVGRDIQVKGEIASCDTLVVGRVEASMDARLIRIAESGVFIGEVGIDYAEIIGRFEGKLTARKRLVIHPTGRVSGIIRYGAIQIEEGGQIMGDVQVIGSGDAEAARRPREAAKSNGAREAAPSGSGGAGEARPASS
jgi:cytoskeletal protein CcmA (bactofilin family)